MNKKLSKQDIKYQQSKNITYRELEHSYASMSKAHDELQDKHSKLVYDLKVIVEDHKHDEDFHNKLERVING